MEMKITERDKSLLSLLACVLIVVGFVWYLIIPATEKSDTLDLQVEEAQTREQEMEMQIASYSAAQEEYDKASEEAKQAAVTYYDLMTTQEVDRELTGIVVSQGLECTNLNIEPLEYADVPAYTRSALARQKELDAAVEAAGDSAESTSSEGSTSSQSEAISQVEAAAETDSDSSETVDVSAQEEIYVYKADVTVSGAEEAYERIIDELTNSNPAIRVTGLSYRDLEKETVINEDGSVEEVDGGRLLTLNLELYMCDKETMGDGE